jgi:hypothetical protein
MKIKKNVALYFSIVGVLAFAIQIPAVEVMEAQKITITDINSGKVVIVGKLGVPIGELVTISGAWKQPISSAKGPTKAGPRPTFEISEINGHQPLEPIVFQQRDITEVFHGLIDTEIGRVQRFEAYESCRYIGISPSAWKGKDSPIADSDPFELSSQFVFVRRI